MPVFRGCKCFNKNSILENAKLVSVPESQKEVLDQKLKELPEAADAQKEIPEHDNQPQRDSCLVETGHVRKITLQYGGGTAIPREALVQQLAGLSDEDVADLLVKVQTMRKTMTLGYAEMLAIQSERVSDAEEADRFCVQTDTKQRLSLPEVSATTQPNTKQRLSLVQPMAPEMSATTQTDTRQRLSLVQSMAPEFSATTQTDSKQRLSLVQPMVPEMSATTQTDTEQRLSLVQPMAPEVSATTQADTKQRLSLLEPMAPEMSATTQTDTKQRLSLAQSMAPEFSATTQTDTKQRLSLVQPMVPETSATTQTDTEQRLSLVQPMAPEISATTQRDTKQRLSLLEPMAPETSADDSAQLLEWRSETEFRAVGEIDPVNVNDVSMPEAAVGVETVMSQVSQVSFLGPENVDTNWEPDQTTQTDTKQRLSLVQPTVPELSATTQTDTKQRLSLVQPNGQLLSQF